MMDMKGKMFDHEKYMSKYEGETMDRLIPNLPEGEKERITFESFFKWSNAFYAVFSIIFILQFAFSYR